MTSEQKRKKYVKEKYRSYGGYANFKSIQRLNTVKIVYRYDPTYEIEDLTVDGIPIEGKNLSSKLDGICDTLEILKIKYTFEKNESWDSNQ